MRIRSFPLTPLILLCLFGVSDLASAAPGEGGEAPVLEARVEQVIRTSDGKMTLKGKALFGTGGRFRLQGETCAPMFTGDDELTVPITIVNDGDKFKQLLSIEDMPQFSICDMKQIRKEFPKVRFGKDLDPREYAGLLQRAADKRRLPDERFQGLVCEIWDIAAGKGYRFSPVPGCPEDFPPPGKLRVWLAKRDHLPRRVEAWDKGGKSLMSLTFRGVRPLKSLPPKALELTMPEDAFEADMTELALGVLRGRKEDGGKVE